MSNEINVSMKDELMEIIHQLSLDKSSFHILQDLTCTQILQVAVLASNVSTELACIILEFIRENNVCGCSGCDCRLNTIYSTPATLVIATSPLQSSTHPGLLQDITIDLCNSCRIVNSSFSFSFFIQGLSLFSFLSNSITSIDCVLDDPSGEQRVSFNGTGLISDSQGSVEVPFTALFIKSGSSCTFNFVINATFETPTTPIVSAAPAISSGQIPATCGTLIPCP